ncbi:MAG: hypothetical protein G01um101456_585 [Parcubacteria group bacterium Gr01-1014_56]|nr:MAG: hypothetical protein G01um101456_585 [Parcubacteria group bacterium Gr01-1014_56]
MNQVANIRDIGVNGLDFVCALEVGSKKVVRGVCLSIMGDTLIVQTPFQTSHTCQMNGAKMIPDAALSGEESEFMTVWLKASHR